MTRSRSRHGRGAAVSGVLIAALGVLPASAGAAVSGSRPPLIKVDRPTLDLGQVQKGQIASGRVEVRNAGDQDLVISRAHAQCRCIHLSYDDTIPGGAAGTVRVKLDTAHLNGAVRHTVSLVSNDTLSPVTKIDVVADILASVILLPNDFVFLDNARAELTRPILVVRKDARDGGRLAVSNVELSVPWLGATVWRVDEPQLVGGNVGAQPGDWAIEIEQTAPANPGRGRETLRFDTGLAAEPVIEVPIRVHLSPAIEPSEKQVVLRRRARGSGAEGEVALRVRRTLDPASMTVETDSPALRVELASGGSRFEVLATVRWDGSGDGTGSVTFRIGPEGTRLPVFPE